MCVRNVVATSGRELILQEEGGETRQTVVAVKFDTAVVVIANT